MAVNVGHILKLARLSLNENESQRLGKELLAILDFVGKLKKADTAKTEPMAGGTTLFNVIRGDEMKPANSEERNKILANVPGRRGDYIEILPVFE